MLSPQEWPFAVERANRANKQMTLSAKAEDSPMKLQARHPSAKKTTIISTIVYDLIGMEPY